MLRSDLFYAKRNLSAPQEMRRYAELIARNAWSADEVAELNWSRRKSIVRHAFEQCPYYRKKYSDAGFDPSDLRDPDDFSRVPVLSKSEVRANSAQLLAADADPRHLHAEMTGGSTGEPLRVYRDGREPVRPLSWRMLHWWGLDASDNSGYLYRAVPRAHERLAQTALLWPTRRAWLAALDMNETAMQRYYSKLQAIRPRYLVGYVGAIDVFGSFMQRRGLRLETLQAVWTTAAPLPLVQRAYLETVFGAPVYTQYGSCEVYWVASECTHQCGMHWASDERHVEVIPSGQGDSACEVGELVVTDLTNRVFPLIRYRIGDRGSLIQGACSCGLPYPRMDYVRGRVSDLIVLPDGNGIPGEYWTTIFDDFVDDVRHFQVHQFADHAVEIRYASCDGLPRSNIERQLAHKLESHLRGMVKLSFVCRQIDLNDNGKSRFVTSDIIRPAQRCSLTEQG